MFRLFRSKYRLKQTFAFAWDGLLHGLGTQRNMRIHFAAAVVVLVLCALLELSQLELALVLLAIGIVIAAELFNTSVEAVVDLVTRDYHPLAKIAKDTGAAAVLVTAATAVVVGFFVFIDKLFPPKFRDFSRLFHTEPVAWLPVALLFLLLFLLLLIVWRTVVRFKQPRR